MISKESICGSLPTFLFSCGRLAVPQAQLLHDLFEFYFCSNHPRPYVASKAPLILSSSVVSHYNESGSMPRLGDAWLKRSQEPVQQIRRRDRPNRSSLPQSQLTLQAVLGPTRDLA
jgi:hypothetical protein